MLKLNVLDLFSGVGGFSLGLQRTGGFKTVAFCEIEPFPRKVLAKHWPEVPIYHDVRELTAAKLAADGIGVDVICGGFPCTDISVAGRGAGIKGKDSGLWSEFARLIGELRPQYAIVENVSALLSRGLADVLGDLAEIGYSAEWHCIPASAVSAPHRRDRIWIVAYSASGRCKGVHDGNAKPNDANPSSYVAHPISGELRHESGRRNGASWASEAEPSDDGKQGLVADAKEQSEWAGLCTSESTEFGWRRFSNGSGENAVANTNGVRCDGWAAEAECKAGSGTGIESGCEAVANTDSGRLESIRLSQHDEQQGASRRQPDGCGEERRREGANVPDANGSRRIEQWRGLPIRKELAAAQCGDWWLVESRMGDLVDGIPAELAGRRLGSIWDTEPDVPRVAHGVKGRVDRLKALGNALVPQIPELIGRAILAASMGEP